jgi:hypothetical protein
VKKFLVIFFLSLSLLFNTNTKADPLTNILITEGIGVGIKIVEFSIEKIKDLNKNYISKKKDKKKLDKLDEGSHIITFSNCKGLEPNYLPNTRFLIDHENQYVRIIEGIDKKEIYYKIKNISGSRVIARELFTLNKKDEKKINEINKNIKVLNIFDLNKKTIEIDIRINPAASKKWKKIFKKDIKKGDLAIYTNAKCIVDGEEILLKEKKKKIDQKATWVAVVKHKEKKISYTSDNTLEINTKQEAINNATSKCWFDPNHKEGDWPSENCIVISVKNTDSNNKEENNSGWRAEFKHSKSNSIFIATNVSTKQKAINIALDKCYVFVTEKLDKVGYNDCYLLKAINQGLDLVNSEINDKWISENKQNYINEFNKKLDEYESLILTHESKKNKVTNEFEKLKLINSEAKNNIINVFDTINTSNPEIKSIKKELKKNEKLYLLSDTDLLAYKNLLKKITGIDFKRSKNYLLLKNIIKKGKKSKKATNFIGTDELEYKGVTLKQAKIGFIQEFNRIKNKDLESRREENAIDKLTNDIEKRIENINEFILKPVDDLFILDDELLTGNNYNYLFMGNQFYSLYKLINHIVY